MIWVTIILFLLGLLLSLIGTLWTGVLGFMDNLFWGLACWLIPLAGFIFIFTRWNSKAVRASLFVQMLGYISLVTAIFIGGSKTISLLKESLKTALTPHYCMEVKSASSASEPPPKEPEPTAVVARNTVSDPAAVVARNAVPDPPLGILPVPAPPSFETQRTFDFDLAMAVGDAAFEKKDYQTALINFRRALKASPDNNYAIAAVSKTESIIKSQNHKKYMTMGYKAFDSGDYQTALLNFKFALEQRPDSPYAAKAIANTTSLTNGKL
ncbi:MAG: hypothetical protein F6J93_03420 [Oscillatoria sp. SIO1A7]|nr:hypothetical protein [Oscillatoria sp. SIO1A7]